MHWPDHDSSQANHWQPVHTFPKLTTSLVHPINMTTVIIGNNVLRVITVATSETDGYERFMYTAKMFNLDVKVRAINGSLGYPL